jgi:thiamine transport system permease protein
MRGFSLERGSQRDPRIAFRLLSALDKLSANRRVSHIVYAASLVFFFALVLLPPVFGIILKLDKVVEVLRDPALLGRSWSAISWSFILAFAVSAIDLILGIPLAWLIARRDPKLGRIVDTLADMPFIIPTVALGFSTLLFWGPDGVASLFLGQALLKPGLALVVLVHFVFSLPVVIRVMVGALSGYRQTFEIAARTLGAEPFTAVRTVTLPILRPSIIASFLLSFARSLSETGATVIVAGTFENGPVLIKNAKDAGLEGPISFVSFVLIGGSVIAFLLIKYIGPKLKLPISRVWPEHERKLSRPDAALTRDLVSLMIFICLALAPSLFVALPSLYALFDGTFIEAVSGRGVWSTYWQSMALSYIIGIIVTVTNMLTGMPMAVLIARRKLGKALTSLMDGLVNIPIVVPSIALGISLNSFWRTVGALPEFWVLTLSHLTITYTYFVSAMSAAIESVPVYLEDTARTLGARPLTVFRRIVLPLTKYSLFSGAILVFSRSVDETGAAAAVSEKLKTVPVLLVDWVKGTVEVSRSTQSLGVGILIAVSFIALLAFRVAVEKRR